MSYNLTKDKMTGPWLRGYTVNAKIMMYLWCVSRLLFPNRDKEEQKAMADRLLQQSGVSSTLRAQDLTVEQFGAVSNNYIRTFVQTPSPPPPHQQDSSLPTEEKQSRINSDMTGTKSMMNDRIS